MRYDAISRDVIFRNRDVVFPFFFFFIGSCILLLDYRYSSCIVCAA